MSTRKIIEIDEEKCTGCGQCILACAEGALILENGKARLVGDIYCDGLGACIGDCPEGALRIIEREAQDFDEEAVEKLLHKNTGLGAGLTEETLPCGCPASQAIELKKSADTNPGAQAAKIESELGHWPVKLQLLNPNAPYLKESDLILLADCAATAFPDLHRKLLRGRAVAMGCPKLDDLEAHIDRLAEILKTARPRSLTVVYMEVPCCGGFLHAAREAAERAGVDLPPGKIIIARTGEILEHERFAETCESKTA